MTVEDGGEVPGVNEVGGTHFTMVEKHRVNPHVVKNLNQKQR